MAKDPDLFLECQGESIPIYLKDGIRSIDETWFEPSSFGVRFSRGNKKYSGDQLLTVAEWNDWTGGRGGQRYDDDETRFHDGLAWTLSEGVAMPPPRWRYGEGTDAAIVMLPGSDGTNNMKWQVMTKRNIHSSGGQVAKYAQEFKCNASGNYGSFEVPLKRVGTPGTLTVSLFSSTTPTTVNGYPDSSLKDVSITTTTVSDLVPELVVCSFATAASLTVNNYYHIVLAPATTDNDQNHWEWLVGNGTYTVDGTYASWLYSNIWEFTIPRFRGYFRLNPSYTIVTRWFFQHFNSKLYAVSSPATGNSQLFEWDETNDVWTEITGHGLTIVSSRPLVSGTMMYFPQGESVNIRRWTGSAWADDGTNKATYLCNWYDSVNKVSQVAKANFSSFAVAPSVSTATDLVFATAINVGDSSYGITGITVHEGALYIIKSDSMWSYEVGSLRYIESNLKNTPSTRNGNVFLSWNNLLYFSWLNTIMQSYGATATDIGQMWRGEGPPGNRAAAYPSCAIGVGSWMFAGYDAGTSGQSYVHVYNGLTWHEIYRAPLGRRIRDIFWQHVDGAQPRLWIEQGNQLVYITLAKDVAGLRYDTTVNYHWAYDIITTTFDDSMLKLSKNFKDLTITTDNLSSTLNPLWVDFQVDDGVGKTGATNWYQLGLAVNNPTNTLSIGIGDKKAIRFRIRGDVLDSDSPPIIRGITLEGYTRAPSRRQWNMMIDVDDLWSGKRRASKTLDFLNRMAETTSTVTIRSHIPEINERKVLIRHPKVSRMSFEALKGWWGGYLAISMLDVT